MTESGRPRILLVDDEANTLEALRRILQPHFDVTLATGANDALELIASQGPFEVVVCDLRMPGMDGLTLLARLREAAPDTVRVILTGYGDVDVAIAAVNVGSVFRFLTKPCPPSLLIRALDASVKQYRLLTARQKSVRKDL